MIKVLYSGKVPAGYYDSGNHDAVIYIDDSKYPGINDDLIKQIVIYDSKQCNDFLFKRIQLIEWDYNGKFAVLSTTYSGYESRYDSYFKKTFHNFKSEIN